MTPDIFTIQKTLNVMDIFSSFQGEGKFAGAPTTFIRFGGCELDCSWCDVPESISRTRSAQEAMTVSDVLRAVDDTRHVCLTGGEPFLQDTDELVDLCVALKHGGHVLSVETNGVERVEYIRFRYLFDLWTVSPKLTSSDNMYPPLRQYADNINKIWYAQRKDMQLKFAIGSREDCYDLKYYLSEFSFIPTYVNAVWDNVNWTPRYTMKQLVKLFDDSGIEYKSRSNLHVGIQYAKVWGFK